MIDEIRTIGEANALLKPVKPVEPVASSKSATQQQNAPQERIAPATPDKPAEPPPSLLLSGELVVEIDKEAGRFVQKLLDPTTGDVLRQYPSEDQLKFSRALANALRAARDIEV